MAELKISELSAAVQVLDSDILPMTSGTSTVKVSAEQIKNYVADSLDVSDSAVTGSYVTAVAEVNGKVSVTREAADASPTENSNKLVKSGGVYTALGAKQDTLTFDNAPTQSSDNPVKSGGVYNALAAKQDTLTFDNTPTQNSDNPVKSGGVYTAVQGAGHTIKDDSSTFTKRANLKFDGFYVEDDSTNDETIVYKVKPVASWSNGSDADIIEALQRHYSGEIDLADYWSVGDERSITLSAIGATSDLDSGFAQTTATFVLMNVGGKTLADGTTECAFIVGMKESLGIGKYAANLDNTGGWRDSVRRTWCNNSFYNAIPSSIRSIFKEHKNKTSAGDRSTTINETTDYFALPSEIEVFGTVTNSVQGEGTQFKYYETSANRRKTALDRDQTYLWWERSPLYNDKRYECIVDTYGASNYNQLNYQYGFSPFGCI